MLSPKIVSPRQLESADWDKQLDGIDLELFGHLIENLSGGDAAPGSSSYPAIDLSSPMAGVPFCTEADAPFQSPNLDDQGIDPRQPHSDTLTYENKLRHVASMEQTRPRCQMEQLAQPPLGIRLQRMQAMQDPSFPRQQMAFEAHHREQCNPEARLLRPQSAMPAIRTGPVSHGMHMPVIPARPYKMQRTTSCPSNGHIYPSPMQMVYGASPQEGQSWHMTPARTPEAERHHRGCVTPTECQDEPDSPPRRKGKGGRQRAPAPDASVDPKRAKRIMANRASAAKSKQKQKEKVQELERQKNAKLEEIKALQHSNSACEEACKALQGQLTKLNDLEQDYHRLQSLNRKLTEFHTVLQKALKDSQGLSWNGIDSQHTCPSQNGYSGAPVSVHAFSTNNMPGALPPLKGAHFDPNTPDMEIPPFLELSDHSFEQNRCVGSTSPQDQHLGSGPC